MTISPSMVAALASSVSVLVGVVLGSLTLRQWHRTRYLSAAAELVHTIQTREFTVSITKVMELPIDADPEGVDAEMEVAVHSVTHVFESLGVLVFYRLLPLHLVDHLLGGYVRASYKRTRRYVHARRQRVGVMFGEWFQWLAERLEQYPAPGKSENAAEVFASWKP